MSPAALTIRLHFRALGYAAGTSARLSCGLLAGAIHIFNDTLMVGVKWLGAFNPISNEYEVEKIFLLTGSRDKIGSILNDREEKHLSS